MLLINNSRGLDLSFGYSSCSNLSSHENRLQSWRELHWRLSDLLGKVLPSSVFNSDLLVDPC